MLFYTQIIEKGISDFFTGLFYSYVSDTQPSSNPFIHGTVVKTCVNYKAKVELISKHRKTVLTAIRPLEFTTLVCLDIQ